MNKYLVKIAGGSHLSHEDRVNLGLGAVGIGSAHYVGKKVGRAASVPIHNAVSGTSALDHKTLRKILRANKDLNATFSPYRAAGNIKDGLALKRYTDGGGPIAVHGGGLKKSYIGVNNPDTGRRTKNLNIAMHELGHLRHDSKLHKAQIKLNNRAYQFGTSSKTKHVPSLLGGAMLANDHTRNYAWLVPLVHKGGVLNDELGANLHGLKMVARHGNAKSVASFTGLAGKNMLGYAAKPLAQSAVLGGLAHLINKAKEKGKKKPD